MSRVSQNFSKERLSFSERGERLKNVAKKGVIIKTV